MDGEGNLGDQLTGPFRTPDGYQIAINQYLGTYICTPDPNDPTTNCSIEHNTNQFDALNRGQVGLSSFAGAYFDALGGNNTGWLGMRGTQIGTVNGASGGVLEMAIPWSDFDAPGLDGNGLDPGLNLNGAIPVAGDQWNFNAGFIGAGPLAVWSWHMDPDPNNPLEAFASQPHGVLTFVAAPAVKGDVDLDGDVDFDDIPAFITVLQAGVFLAEADCDCDLDVDFDDIPAFITILQSQ